MIVEVTLDQAGPHAVDPDADRGQLLGEADGHRVDRTLRRGVVHPLARTAEHGRLRRDVDDGPADAAAIGAHACCRLTAGDERTGDVHGPQPLEHVGVDGVDRAVPTGDAGVVDEDVDAAEPTVDGLEHPHHLALVAHVGLHRKGSATGLAERCCQFVGGGGRRGEVQDQVVVLRCRSPGDGRADAARRPGDEHDATCVGPELRVIHRAAPAVAPARRATPKR